MEAKAHDNLRSDPNAAIREKLSALKISGLEDSSDSDGPETLPDSKENAEVLLKGLLSGTGSDSDDDEDSAAGTKTRVPTTNDVKPEAEAKRVPEPSAVAEDEKAAPKSPNISAAPMFDPAGFPENTMAAAANQDAEEEEPEVSSLPATSPQTPLEIVDRYEIASRLLRQPGESRPTNYLKHDCGLVLARMEYTEYRKIGDLLSSPEKEKLWGRPTCVSASSVRSPASHSGMVGRKREFLRRHLVGRGSRV